jgi:hypothetical protein
MKYLKEKWHTLIFPSFFILFVFFMVLEYYRGNCRISKDIWVCNYIDVEKTMKGENI